MEAPIQRGMIICKLDVPPHPAADASDQHGSAVGGQLEYGFAWLRQKFQRNHLRFLLY